jgi:hypothetical protein
MKKLMTLGLLASSFVFADEPSQTVASIMQAPGVAPAEIQPIEANYGYVSIGLGPFPIPAPLLGIGGRLQRGHHGFDGSLQFFTWGKEFTIIKENFNYLYYFKPNLASQFYVGGGIGFTELVRRHFDAYVSPQVILGKQYTNEAGDVRFFQVQIDPVFFSLNRNMHVLAFPAVVISYGICF